MKRDIVILGSGIAGYSAAHAIKGTTRDVDLTIVSEEPDPTYSACVFAEYVAGEIRRENVFLKGWDREVIERSKWMPDTKVDRIDLDGGGIFPITTLGAKRVRYPMLLTQAERRSLDDVLNIAGTSSPILTHLDAEAAAPDSSDWFMYGPISDVDLHEGLAGRLAEARLSQQEMI